MNTLLFDFETTGVGLPINKQRAIQLSWIIIDVNNEIIETFDYYINNQTELNTEFHKNLSIDYINKNGIFIEIVLDRFAQSLRNSSKIVAHNIDFDLDVLFNEIYINNYSTFPYTREDLNKIKYCTMKNSIDICKIMGKYGRYKWPKLSELYQHFFNKNPEIELHNSINDVLVMYECYKKMKCTIETTTNEKE